MYLQMTDYESNNNNNKSVTMYISLPKEDYRILENDIALFRSNTYVKDFQFSTGMFINRIYLIMEEILKNKVVDDKKTDKRTSKKIGKNIKIRNDVIQKLKTHFPKGSNPYPSDMAKRLVSVLQEYCCKTLAEREKIFYRNTVKEIQKAIIGKLIITVRQNNGNLTTILPYKIVTAEEIGLNYIACFILEKENNRFRFKRLGDIPLRTIIPYNKQEQFRSDYIREDGEEISSIIDFPEDGIFDDGLGNDNKKYGKYEPIHNYQEMYEYMVKRLNTDGILYLPAIPQNVRVRLTEDGKQYLTTRTQYRPASWETDEKDNSVICFKATWLQTFLYFFKFGAEAEILAPQQYRDNFAKEYQRAYQLYQNNENSNETKQK